MNWILSIWSYFHFNYSNFSLLKRLQYDAKASFQDVHQRKLEIGDLILLKKDEICVADIIVLACEEDKCIVETTEIEG